MLQRTAFGLLFLAMAACGDDSSGSGGAGGSATGVGGGDATSTGSGGAANLEARHARYCEVLIGYLEGNQVRLDVWNTWTLNDCPQDLWDALDTKQIADENDATIAVLNGPRYWALDKFVDSAPPDKTIKEIGGIEFFKPAELYRDLADLDEQQQDYVSMTVDRDTTYLYEAGKMVQELVDPDGGVWVMQTYDGEQGPKTDEELAQLGTTLAVPEGWSARARTLDADLFVDAAGTAYILRDDANSTYQLSQQ